jgi:peptidoglycan hydrolase CwlO-like protein
MIILWTIVAIGMVWLGISLTSNTTNANEDYEMLDKLTARASQIERQLTDLNTKINEQKAIASWANAIIEQLSASWAALSKERQQIFDDKVALGVFTKSQR